MVNDGNNLHRGPIYAMEMSGVNASRGGRSAQPPEKTMDIVIVGCGGHGRVVADNLRAAGQPAFGFLDDAAIGLVGGLPVLGGVALIDDPAFLDRYAVIVAIGDNAVRRGLAGRVLYRGGRLALAIHPAAVIAADVDVGAGSVVMAGAVINTGSRIGRFAIVNTGATVDHDNLIADGVNISPGCHLAGAVQCEADVFLGTGVTIIPRIRVGPGAIVAAGATVIRDVDPSTMVAGCPATVRCRIT